MRFNKSLLFVLIICFNIVFLNDTVLASNLEDYRVYVNNASVKLDVPPVIIDHRTFIPLRNIAEAMGALVEWEDSTESITVIKAKNTIILKLDSKNALVNGMNKDLDAPARLINGRTMVPLRFIGESLDAAVGFNENSKSIIVNFGVINVPNEKPSGLVFKTINFPNDELYQGETKDGKMHGQGTYTWPFGKKYIGSFVDGEIEGEGVMNFPDGAQYRGEFYKGYMHGNGKYIWFTGRIDEGMWHLGKYMGEM